jgi:hypothetical protein
MPLQTIVAANLRRTQAFDAELRSADEIDRIANEFAAALLGEPSQKKRKPAIDSLVSRLVKHAESTVIPQAQRIGTQNALDLLSGAPKPIDLNDPQQRASALLRGRQKASDRIQIIRTAVGQNGNTLDAALTRYWLEPGEGGQKDKLARLRQIHEDMEKRRKAWEAAMRDFHAGKTTKRPTQPNLDYLSALTAESKKDVREQARRAGTDMEIATFEAKGYAKFIWITPNGAAACPDCQNRQSVILTIAEWERMGRPGSGKTVCGANCYCTLIPAEAGKANPQLLSRGSRDKGPSTTDDQLRVLNANRVASVAGVEKKEGQASALASKIPKTTAAEDANREAVRKALAEKAAKAQEAIDKRNDPFRSGASVKIHTPVSDAFKAEIRKAYSDIPVNVRDRMEANGQEFHFSEFFTDARPDLKGQHPRGWRPGATWDEAEGAGPGGQTYVSQKKRLNANDLHGYNSNRIPGVFRHEYGHNVDHIWDKARGYLSQTPEFRDAYRKDFDKLTDSEKRSEALYYYCQRGDGGPSEAFAEGFGNIYGGGCDTASNQVTFAEKFPNVMQQIKDMLQ